MRLRLPLFAVAALVIALAAPLTAQASLTLLRPDPQVSGTFYGHGGLSTDGWSTVGDLEAEVPAGSTIYRAWLYAVGTPGAGAWTDVTFADTTIPMTLINNDDGGTAYRGDVTAEVAAAVTSAGGVFPFQVTQPAGSEGVALAVIYENPASPNRTIAILDGGSLPSGDSVTFSFASPIDPTVAGFDATLALGISFSYQDGGQHDCNGGQVSLVDINGRRLSSCAGSYDDGVAANGALITVGGVGDDTSDPPDPNGTGGSDDELYDLVPSLAAGDTNLTVSTVNPSGDDYIFLAAVSITAEASVVVTAPPTISSIADQAIPVGSDTGALPFTVDDAETAAADLTVTASSSDQILFPDGNLVLGGTGNARTITATPASGQTGTATITLVVTDADSRSATTSFEVLVSAPVGPSAVDDADSTPEDTVLHGTSVLANDDDPAGGGLTAAVVTDPAHGDLALALDGTFDYSPDADFNGTDTFTYTAADGSDVSAPATVTLTIDPVPDQPVCTGGTLSTAEDAGVDGQVVCTTVDGVPVSVTVTSPAAGHGSVTAIDPVAGSFTYTPDADFTGTDTIWFVGSVDGAPDSAPVAFTVEVGGQNDAPVAVDDSADAVQADEPIAVSIDVLANDTDADGDTLTITDVSTPAHGVASIDGDHVRYTPEAGYQGPDTFTYSIADPAEATDSASVSVTVAPDVTGPSLGAPGQSFIVPSLSTRTAAPVRFSWPAGTDVSGITSYEARLSTDGGEFVAVGAPSMTRTRTVTLATGHAYRFSIRATDRLGNVSAWTSGPRFRMAARQTPAFTYTKHWTIIEAGSSAGTGFRYSTRRGATASITVVGRSFAWVAPKNTKSGKAAVYVDGRYVRTVNLHAPHAMARRVVFQLTFSSSGSHTVTIRNLGTHGHPRVSLDALMFLR